MSRDINEELREYDKRSIRAVCMSPRDYFLESTMPIQPRREYEYHEEIAAITGHPYFEEDGYGKMHLGYDIFTDTCYVICKLTNNGTTFVSSRNKLFMERLENAGI